MKGLEPPRLSALDPKSSAATNYATCANRDAKLQNIFELATLLLQIFIFRARKGRQKASRSHCRLNKDV